MQCSSAVTMFLRCAIVAHLSGVMQGVRHEYAPRFFAEAAIKSLAQQQRICFQNEKGTLKRCAFFLYGVCHRDTPDYGSGS